MTPYRVIKSRWTSALYPRDTDHTQALPRSHIKMPRLTVTIQVNNKPLKRAYVEHVWRFGIIGGPIQLYMTDDQGEFHFNSQTNDADIRIMGQNSVARIIEGGGIGFVADIWVYKKVGNRDVVRLDTREEKVQQFQILNQALEHYDSVHRQFVPFSVLPNPNFPLGKRETLQKTKDQARRIEIVYPDNLFQELAFVEPKSIRTSYPLVHLKGPGQGRGDGSGPLPHEFAHALHFALLDGDKRGDVELNYAKFLIGDALAGGRAHHGFNIQTTPMVAYIEAFGLFSERFARYQTSSAAEGAALHTAFVQAELQRPDTARIVTSNAPVQPAFMRDDVEGAVYGAIFVHFASLTTLATAVEAFYRSEAVTFDGYHRWIHANMGQVQATLSAIDEVKSTWGM